MEKVFGKIRFDYNCTIDIKLMQINICPVFILLLLTICLNYICFFRLIWMNLVVGKQEVIHDNTHFSLQLERIKGADISNKFNADSYKFKVSLHSKNRGNLIIDDDNVNYVLKGLLIIFDRIRNCFKKKNGKAYIQINLTFDGLKKVYLKSGIVNLFDRHSKMWYFG